METCSFCNQPVSGSFCSQCGKPLKLKRINNQYILHEISTVLNLDKGFFYTIREVMLRPGHNVRKFIQEDRNRLVKPIVFLLLCSLIYSLSQQIFHFEDGYIDVELNQTAVTRIFQWTQDNYGYANIIMSLFIGAWLKLLFRKSTYNIYEILILIFFVMGVSMLIFSIFGIAESLLQFPLIQYGAIIAFVYCTWAIGKFFAPTRFITYIKSFFAYFLGYISFTFLAILVGILLELA